MGFWTSPFGEETKKYLTRIYIVVGTIIILLGVIAVGVWRKK